MDCVAGLHAFHESGEQSTNSTAALSPLRCSLGQDSAPTSTPLSLLFPCQNVPVRLQLRFSQILTPGGVADAHRTVTPVARNRVGSRLSGTMLNSSSVPIAKDFK